MILFLRKNQQFFILFIFLYTAIAVFSVYFTQPLSQYTQHPFQLPLLMDFIPGLYSQDYNYFLLSIILYAILLLLGFYLVRIGINNLIITKRSQFSALFFISITAFVLKLEFFHSIAIASVFLLLAIDRIIGSIDKYGRSYRFIDAGLLLGLGSFFYFNLIFLFPFLWVAQILLRPLSWREFSYSLIGLSLPFLYLLAGAYIFNRSIPEVSQHIFDWIVLRRVLHLEWPFLTAMGIYLFAMLIGSLFAMQKFAATKVHARKLYQLFFYLFINIVLIVLIIPSTGIEILYLLAIPSSILLSIYFTDCRPGFINGILLLILLLAPLVVNLL